MLLEPSLDFLVDGKGLALTQSFSAIVPMVAADVGGGGLCGHDGGEGAGGFHMGLGAL